MRSGSTAFVLTVLAIAVAGVVLAFTAPSPLRTSMAGAAPSTVDATAGGEPSCGGLGLPFASDVLEVAAGRVVGTPPPGVALTVDPGGRTVAWAAAFPLHAVLVGAGGRVYVYAYEPPLTRAEVRGGAVVAWASDAPVRAAPVAGTERVNLYWYEPPATADADLRAPAAPDGGAAPVLGVELCRAGGIEPDLAEVCIRAGHVPVAGPSTCADGRFDGALGTRFEVAVDPDDGTLSWRSDGVPVSAVVTATSSPVLVEYDPPVTAGADVPFLGTGVTTGRVQFCGIVIPAG